MPALTMQPPDLQKVISPLLPALPAAAVSLRPSDSVLPLLTPILQQRVQLLSFNSSNDPWIRLLCYEPANVPKLAEIAQSERFEPHPVSGEVEIDWDYDVEIRYRRLDKETLQALVAIKDLGLVFRLLYCTGDPNTTDTWKVGEVNIAEKPSPFSSFGGFSTLDEAERQFTESGSSTRVGTVPSAYQSKFGLASQQEEEDDDDDYWARYDQTPGAKTPAMKRSPAPASMQNKTYDISAEDTYFAQYDDVQPAMDNHDPDEEVNIQVSPPLGLGRREDDGEHGIQDSWTLAEPPPRSNSSHSRSGDDPNLAHPYPRPVSSAGSASSIEKLEAAAARQEQSDFGVKQHVSRSIKSLFMLSRASGIEREEFEQIVKTELDMLALMED
ncbi:hypothetical protein F5Y16DRAFT_365589 [Xylariaceae sp. FL0255]|nr:hypothetical protein F5Y16DRAFT_365589 [Xylariaceae sp. FL0255]